MLSNLFLAIFPSGGDIIRVITTETGFKLEATTRKDQRYLMMVFTHVQWGTTFKKKTLNGDMAHTKSIEFEYDRKVEPKPMKPQEEQD